MKETREEKALRVDKAAWGKAWRRLIKASLALTGAKRAERMAAQRLRKTETRYTFRFGAGGGL